MDQLQAGDLVFFGNPNAPDHVGMYIGNGEYIQSPETGDVVKISNLSDRSDYSAARRIIYSSNPIETNITGIKTIEASSLDNSLEGLLKGYGNDFIKAGQKYGVDPYLLAAISMFESARGTSQPIREYNNPSGIMDASTGFKEIRYFNSLQEAIEYTAYNLRTGYLDKGLNTIEKIAQEYAPVGADNDIYGTNIEWAPSVRSIYKELSGKEPSNLIAIKVPEKDLSNVESEMQQLLDKSISKKTSKIDLQQNIMDNNKEIYESYLEQMENEIKLIDTKIKKTQLEKDMKAQDSFDYIKFLKQEAIYNNDKIQKVKKEKEFIDEQIKNKDKIYSNKTISEMQEKSRELEVSIKEIVKSVKDANFSWIDSKLQSINKRVQENVDMINNAISRIENSDNSNLVEQIQLKAQIVELDKQNVEELQSFMEELNDEQRRSGAAYLSEKLKEVNVELDNANTQLQQNKKELKEIKNTIASLIENVEDKIKQVIQKNNELYKESLEKNLKLFEKAVDEQIKKLDEAEKRINHNETTYDDNKKIFELQEKLNRLELNDSIEGKQKKLELEKELNQAIRQQKSNQVKYEISSRKESLQKAKDDYNKYLQEYNDKISRLEVNDNLNIEAKQALIDGYILDLNGNRIEIEKALLDFEDKFGKGLSSIGEKIKTELIDNLNEVRNILTNFDTLDTTKIKPNQKSINVYGKGIDLENAKKVLGAKGYNYVDTNTVDKEDIHLNPNDIVLGGEKVNLDRKDLNGALRFDGKDRYKTLELIQLYKDIKDGKIPREAGNVYGSGIDLTNAKKWLGMFGYNFVDTSTKKVTPSDIGANDIVVGGKSAKNGVDFDVNNRLSGGNREATDKAIYEKFLDIANSKIEKYYKTGSNIGTVYGSGVDLTNAKKYLSKLGYNFVETNDVRDKKLTPNDIVVGGEGAMQGKDNILNSQATWLKGKNRSETENLIKEYAYKYIASDLPINWKGYSEGGVVSQTGLAMVHGGDGHDEIFLNNAQATNLFNFIKNLPHMTKNIIPNLNIPSLQNMIKPMKSDSNHQSNEEYNISINVNGTLNATEDEANKFANLVATKLRKRR